MPNNNQDKDSSPSFEEGVSMGERVQLSSAQVSSFVGMSYLSYASGLSNQDYSLLDGGAPDDVRQN